MEKKSIKDILHSFVEKAKENHIKEGHHSEEGSNKTSKLSEILKNMKKNRGNHVARKNPNQKLSEIIEKIKQRKAESEHKEEANNESNN